MTRIAWITDPHLDHASENNRKSFADSLSSQEYDLAVVSGDIGNALTFNRWVSFMASSAGRPVCFVLGNHDYYGCDWNASATCLPLIRETRALAGGSRQDGAVYLSSHGVYEASPSVAVIGHDGWYDGRYAGIFKSTVRMSDHAFIKDIRGLPYERLDTEIKKLSDEAAMHVERNIESAAGSHKTIVIVTHVPPFPECATYRGKVSDRNWLPWFSSKAMGDVLLEASTEYPGTSFLVLCGHSHGGSDVQKTRNLRVITGEAQYGNPRVLKLLDL